jgi:hypothetical protein
VNGTAQQPLRQGVPATTLPLFISRRSTPANNIFVGDTRAHVQHAERVLGVRAENLPRVTDDDLLGHRGRLLWVSNPSRIDLSPNVRKQTGVWAADPIIKGSAAATAIVKLAASYTGKNNVPRELIQRVADGITRTEITDVRVALWQAADMLDCPPPNLKEWLMPWESPHWLLPGQPLEHRLNNLYEYLVGWAYVFMEDKEGAKRYNVSPARAQFFSNLKLDVSKVERTITVLSGWRGFGSSAAVCALKVTLIWSR